jgi:NAD(P)-dependent dehydrogenase (short-subunit alcohol dehydrogenase family)
VWLGHRSGTPLDILICNAGLMSPPQRLVTKDGLEMQFQVGPTAAATMVDEAVKELQPPGTR